MPERDEPNPARVVADADVLAADLLLGGDAREALDHVRRHSWVELVASDPLLAQTERLVSKLADPALAADHRERLEAERVSVDQPEGTTPRWPRPIGARRRTSSRPTSAFDRRKPGSRSSRGCPSASVRRTRSPASSIPRACTRPSRAASTRGRIGILERSRGGPAREATTVPRAGSHELIERRESYPTGARSIEGL